MHTLFVIYLESNSKQHTWTISGFYTMILSNFCQWLYSFKDFFSVFFFFFSSILWNVSSSNFVLRELYLRLWINQLVLFCLLSSCCLTPQGIPCPCGECSCSASFLQLCSLLPALLGQASSTRPVGPPCREPVWRGSLWILLLLQRSHGFFQSSVRICGPGSLTSWLLPHFASLPSLPCIHDALFCLLYLSS